jgi:hypothetical protein
MSRWEASGARAFGLWEYAFGSGFVIPREPVAALADAVREGWKRGARGYFAEIGSSSGLDTFKAWALARMLWNPGLSLSDLEDDFFPGYYGPAGAPMRRFHEACQARWMGQEGGPFWLKYYGQDDQALLFPDKTCASLRAILSEADRLVSGDPVFSARVGRASRAFAVAEAYVAFDSERRVLAAACPNRSDPFPGGEGALEEAIGRLARARARFEAAYRDAAPDGDSQRPEPSVSDSLERDDPVPRLLFGAGCRDSSAPRRLLNGAGVEAATRPPWREMASSFAVGLPAAPNLTANSSFLEKDTRGEWPHFLYPRYGALPAKWTLRAMATEEGRVAIVDNESSGADLQRRSVRIEGAWDTQLYQWLPAKPGLAYLATARLRGRTSPGGDASLFLTFLSGTGGVLSGWMQSLPKGDTTGWRTQALCDRAPDRTGWVGIGIGCSRQTAGDWMEADCVEIRSETSATLP